MRPKRVKSSIQPFKYINFHSSQTNLPKRSLVYHSQGSEFTYLVCPKDSRHIGSITTGLTAHSKIAKANANSLGLLHI